MGWNGADLVSDFSSELGDTSTAFKLKVLKWINEGFRDISTSHQWPFLRKKGQFPALGESSSLVPSQPSAPSVAISTGGSLTENSVYKVLVTFYEGVAEVESIAGAESASVTATASDKTIDLTSIPVSTHPLVTARRVYLSKDGASFFLHSTIANNTATTLSISTETTSVVTPPDQNYIFQIDGDLYIEGDRMLEGYSLQRLRFETNGTSADGTPSVWASIDQETITLYPQPTTSTTVSFYYFKLPAQVFDSATSIPQVPAWMYEAIHDYVIWRGYQYRDRSGQESKRSNYDTALRTQISRKGLDKKKFNRVRSVTPDSDGFAT